MIPKKTNRKTGIPGQIRLNRYIASSGICSRRDADDLIRRGLVEINGKKITELGTLVKPSDQVKVRGKLIQNAKKVYILLNKPKDTITTTDDPQHRNTVLDRIKGATSERVYPVGRLDRNTTGVLLLTNDGELAARLTHPSNRIKKIYEVTLNRKINPKDLKKLTDGILLDDGMMKVDRVGLSDPANPKTIGLEIHSGKNRIVRRIFEHLGYEVVKLDRVFFAGLTKKNLPRGKWRKLNPAEIGWLKMMKNAT